MKLPLSDGSYRDAPGVTYGTPDPPFAAKYGSPAKETVRRKILAQVVNWLEFVASTWTGKEIAAHIRRLENEP